MARFFRRTKTDADTTDIDLPDSGASAPTRTPAPRSRSRARVSTDTSADGARNADSEAAPARRAPARKRAPARARATTDDPPSSDDHTDSAETPSAAPSRRRGSRGGRGRSRATTDAPSDADTSDSAPVPDKAPKSAPARKRAPARKSAAKAPTASIETGPPPETAPAAPAATGDAEADFVALIKHQTALLEQQTRLLQSLVDGAGASAASGDVSLKLRMALFVDVPNILYAAERSGVTVDWEKVQAFLGRGRTLVRSIAYAPISDDPDVRRDMERFVLPFLDKDYRIVTKPLKRFSGGAVKANFDVELAIDILTMADRLDVIGLISGDGDFRRLVEIVSARGVRVEVVAFGHSTSKDIREVADRYIDIAAYVPELCESN